MTRQHRVEEREADGASAPVAAVAPKLADGVDLIGKYEDSGFKEPPFMARRADGQVIQLPEVLFHIAENADGHTSVDAIAERISEGRERAFSGGNVEYLIDRQLRPLGILSRADGTSPTLERNDPMLALNVRAAVVPESAVQRITSVLRPLFLVPVVLAVLLGVGTLDFWVFFMHGVAQSVRELLYQPLAFLLVFVLIIASAGFHECGHATACRYGGARPGPLGAGIYLIWPVFYSDVTDAYRLNRAGRLRTDLGGVYFNCIFMLLTAGAYFLTHFELLLFVVVLQNFEVLRQFMPFLRLDGYYVVADLTGVPDIFSRIKPTLLSLLPGRPPDKRVTELKTWARGVVTVWAIGTVLLLTYFYGAMLTALPRILGTTFSSIGLQWHRLQVGYAHGSVLEVVVDALQIVLLALPVGGIAMSLYKWLKRLLVSGWKRTQPRPWLRSVFAGAVAVASLVALYCWLPHGDNYRPIGPSERGTVFDSVKGVAVALDNTFLPLDQSHHRRVFSVVPPVDFAGGGIPAFGILGWRAGPFLLPPVHYGGVQVWAISVPVSRSVAPVSVPSVKPSVPSAVPSVVPSGVPSVVPTAVPSVLPSVTPTPAAAQPSSQPTPSP